MIDIVRERVHVVAVPERIGALKSLVVSGSKLYVAGVLYPFGYALWARKYALASLSLDAIQLPHMPSL